MSLPVKTEVGRGRISYVPDVPIATDVLISDIDTQTLAVAKTEVGDVVQVSLADEATVGIVSAYVSANNVITLKLMASDGDDANFATNSAKANLTIFHRR